MKQFQFPFFAHSIGSAWIVQDNDGGRVSKIELEFVDGEYVDLHNVQAKCEEIANALTLAYSMERFIERKG